jgi:hypothetical protein
MTLSVRPTSASSRPKPVTLAWRSDPAPNANSGRTPWTGWLCAAYRPLRLPDVNAGKRPEPRGKQLGYRRITCMVAKRSNQNNTVNGKNTDHG